MNFRTVLSSMVTLLFSMHLQASTLPDTLLDLDTLQDDSGINVLGGLLTLQATGYEIVDGADVFDIPDVSLLIVANSAGASGSAWSYTGNYSITSADDSNTTYYAGTANLFISANGVIDGILSGLDGAYMGYPGYGALGGTIYDFTPGSVFNDGSDFAGRFHGDVGDVSLLTLDQPPYIASEVPVPAALPLMATALFGLAGMARRRQA